METRLISTLALDELTDLIEKSFVMYQEFEPRNTEQLVMRTSIPSGTGDSRRFDEMDTETFARGMAEGKDASKVSVAHGYTKTMYWERRAAEIDITYKMRSTGKDREIMAKIQSLTHYCPERKELDLTHRFFTFATSTAYTDMDGNSIDVTGGDSLAPVYSAHTLKHSSSTWRNRVANDPVFSQGALEAAETLANTNILNNFGETREMDFNIIITGKDAATVREVRKVLESTSDIDQNNPGVVNTYSGYRHVILPKLATDANGAYDSTKRRWWGIIAEGKLQAHFGVWEENNLKTPSAGNNGEDVHNDNWTYGSRMSYGTCLVSARGLIMSNPTS
jgi:hypothetical protein